MIIYHQKNQAGFKGNHIWYSVLKSVIQSRVSKTSAAPANTLIEQSGGLHRFVFSRICGRVN